jgi:hypothetical protein
MAGKNGGARPGAGRKPKVEEEKIIQRLSPMDDIALASLKAGLEAGEYNFVKLFMEYRFGKPKQDIDVISNGQPLAPAIINIYQPKDDSVQ